ncbi:MAG: OmpA family protein [Paracoccaceae bacterium]
MTDNEEVGLDDLRTMATLLIGAERVSTTFRFVKNSSTLDARAQRDVARLLEWLAGRNMVDKEILLVGFADSVGKFCVNIVLAEQRAQQVLEKMTAIASAGVLEGLQIKTVGLGEVSPLACSNAPNGRFINRRFEVWIHSF